MKTAPSTDPLLQSLARLPAAAADLARDARVRDRCHAALDERHRRLSHGVRYLVWRPLETVLVGAFGLVYLVAILYDVARVYR